MSKKSWVYTSLFIALLALAAWLRLSHVDPVPRWLVGEWENETNILSAGPGEIRLAITGDGSIDIRFDRQRYTWWGSDRLGARVRDDIAEVWTDPKHPVAFKIEFANGRMRLSNSDGLEFVFRLVRE